MDILFKNAKVYIEKESFAKELLVTDGRIAKIDPKEYPEDVSVIDCGGKTLIPGFSDSHMHLFGLALKLGQPETGSCESVEDLVQRCRDFIKANPESTAKGLYAAGWNQDLFKGEKRIPSLSDVDAVSDEIPVRLERTCGHIVCCNSRLLEMLEREGMDLTEEQRRTGVFTEGDVKAPKELITKYSVEELAPMVLKAMKRCASLGVTSVASNDAEFVFRDHDLVCGSLAYIYDNNLAPVRYRQQISFSSFEEFAAGEKEGAFVNAGTGKDAAEDVTESAAESIKETGFGCITGNKWFQNGPLKLFADGSLGARTAHMRKGYADNPDNKGIQTITEKDLEEHCRYAEKAGLQVVTHGIGDGAVEKIVNVYERVFGKGNPLRCGIIHCQITDETLLRRISECNIPVLVQPVFLDYDIMIAEDRCGHDLAATSYAFDTLFKNGHMSFGTDCPVEDCDPFAGIYSAVTRKRMDGTPEEGWFREECMDIFDAVDAYTAESAYIAFAEDRRGRIREGFDADLVLLEQDIFTVEPEQIKDIRPILTMTGGRIVYSRD